MSRRFQVGLSSPGELRDSIVGQVAKILALRFIVHPDDDGQRHVLYDEFTCNELNQPGLCQKLPFLYRKDCEVLAIFLCAEYSDRHWCGLE